MKLAYREFAKIPCRLFLCLFESTCNGVVGAYCAFSKRVRCCVAALPCLFEARAMLRCGAFYAHSETPTAARGSIP